MASNGVQLTETEQFIFSSSAAVASKIISNPLENAKLLKQLRNVLSETEDLPIYLSNPSRFTLIFLYQMIKSNGLSSAFSGLSFNIFRYFGARAVNMLLNTSIKPLIKRTFRSSQNASMLRRVTSNIMSGTVAGSLSLLFLYPLDVYRTVYAIDINGQHKLTWSRMYAGYGLSCFGILAYRLFYFGLYNALIAFRPRNGASVFGSFVFGYSVTVASGLLSYPIGTIQRSQMITGQGSYVCAKSLIQKHGWLSLFDGAGMNIWRGMVSAMSLSLFDGLKGVYIERKKSEKVSQLKREILQYRQIRNRLLLCEVEGNRDDWKVIIESVVCVYLDEYMQNENMFALQLTDAFAVQKWKLQRITQYLGGDMQFYSVE